MVVKIKKEIEQEFNIPVPSFWKSRDGNTWTAVLDDDTSIKFYHTENLTTIMHEDPDSMAQQIRDAHQNFNLCEESEWLDKYQEVLKSISLAPQLTVGRLYDQDALTALSTSIWKP